MRIDVDMSARPLARPCVRRGRRSLRIISVVGARPNFVKIAPILRAFAHVNATAPRHGTQIESLLVHTEQHYDDAMSATFFADLGIPKADWTLGVGSGSHATQTADVMRRFEPVLLEQKPDIVLVVGDVNSTMACALTAAKLNIPVAHVEAGLRSFDWSMPEEVNRVVTDSVSQLLFTTEESANDHLRCEGRSPEQTFFVGNVMIDSLLACARLARGSHVLERLGLHRKGDGRGYALVTLHRPSNVDREETLRSILGALAILAQEIPVVFPAHPRTRARIEQWGLRDSMGTICSTREGAPRAGRVSLIGAVGYVDFLRLMSEARLVLTDSGGIQDETTCLGVPCLTLRANTERPITLSAGTSILVGNDPQRILTCARQVLSGDARSAARPPLWDGHAAERIARILVERASAV